MNKKVVIGIVVVAILVAIAGSVAYFAVNNKDKNEQTSSNNTNNNGENNNQNTNNNENDSLGKVLVVYFSAQNHTKEVANKIASNLNADTFEIVPQDVYTSEDLDYTNNNSRVTKEHEDESLRDIKLVTTKVNNWDDYDTVLIGYPIWWVTNHYVRQNESLLV